MGKIFVHGMVFTNDLRKIFSKLTLLENCLRVYLCRDQEWSQ